MSALSVVLTSAAARTRNVHRSGAEASPIHKLAVKRKLAKHTREFRGKTELDIEAQFLRWQQANAGLLFNVERHPIEATATPGAATEICASTSKDSRRLFNASRIRYRETAGTAQAAIEFESHARQAARSSHAEVPTSNWSYFANRRLLLRSIARPNAMPANTTGRSSVWVRRR